MRCAVLAPSSSHMLVRRPDIMCNIRPVSAKFFAIPSHEILLRELGLLFSHRNFAFHTFRTKCEETYLLHSPREIIVRLTGHQTRHLSTRSRASSTQYESWSLKQFRSRPRKPRAQLNFPEGAVVQLDPDCRCLYNTLGHDCARLRQLETQDWRKRPNEVW